MTEEVTNLIAEAREEIFAWGEGDHHVTNVLARVTDALERSATETSDKNLLELDEWIRRDRDLPKTLVLLLREISQDMHSHRRPVVAVVSEDPKPAKPYVFGDVYGADNSPRGIAARYGVTPTPSTAFDPFALRSGSVYLGDDESLLDPPKENKP